jgi:nitrogen fixation-related uncharacterized protein
VRLVLVSLCSLDHTRSSERILIQTSERQNEIGISEIHREWEVGDAGKRNVSLSNLYINWGFKGNQYDKQKAQNLSILSESLFSLISKPKTR